MRHYREKVGLGSTLEWAGCSWRGLKKKDVSSWVLCSPSQTVATCLLAAGTHTLKLKGGSCACVDWRWSVSERGVSYIGFRLISLRRTLTATSLPGRSLFPNCIFPWLSSSFFLGLSGFTSFVNEGKCARSYRVSPAGFCSWGRWH